MVDSSTNIQELEKIISEARVITQNILGDLMPRYRNVRKLKGGENSHLTADLWVPIDMDGKPGKVIYAPEFDYGQKTREPGWINIGDLSSALRTSVGLGELYRGTENFYVACASKHTRPVVIAVGRTQLEALIKAMGGDLNSPFGGNFGFNTPVEYDTAQFLDRMFIEGVIAPGFERESIELLRAGKKGERRFLVHSGNPTLDEIDGEFSFQPLAYKNILRQTREPRFDPRKECVVVTGNDGNTDINSLSPRIINDIEFAGNAAIYLSSNLVFFVHNGAVSGLGDGCGARTIAAEKARLMLGRSVYAAFSRESQPRFRSTVKSFWDMVLYDTPFNRKDFESLRFNPDEEKDAALSDALYPKIDGFIETSGVDRTHPEFQRREYHYVEREKGVDVEKTFIPKVNNYKPHFDLGLIPSVVVQPGGSLGDKLVIPMAEQYGIRMVFTMTPNQYQRVQAGEKGITGRRFFGHHIMV